MSKPLRFTKAEMQNAARLSRDLGVVVKLGRDGSLLVFPDTHKSQVDTTEEDDLDAELSAFRAKHGNG